MPLSKARDKTRKQKERARNRLDKLLSPSAESNAVQPKDIELPNECYWKLELDADGNPIYGEN